MLLSRSTKMSARDSANLHFISNFKPIARYAYYENVFDFDQLQLQLVIIILVLCPKMALKRHFSELFTKNKSGAPPKLKFKLKLNL
jgi:hypothetical protein